MSNPVAQEMRKSRSWLPRALVLIAAVAIGLALQSLVASHLGAIQRRADSDLLGARAELAFVLQVVAVGLFGSIAALGVWMTVASRRALVLRRFPPPGAWASATGASSKAKRPGGSRS